MLSLSSFVPKMSSSTMMIVGVMLLFLGVGLYYYFNVAQTKSTFLENKEFVDNEFTDEAMLYFFHTTWCPHCKKARPEWEKVVKKVEGQTINGVKVITRDVDCDKEDELAGSFGVEGYPTIKLAKGNQVFDFDAPPKADKIMAFLETSL